MTVWKRLNGSTIQVMYCGVAIALGAIDGRRKAMGVSAKSRHEGTRMISFELHLVSHLSPSPSPFINAPFQASIGSPDHTPLPSSHSDIFQPLQHNVCTLVAFAICLQNLLEQSTGLGMRASESSL